MVLSVDGASLGLTASGQALAPFWKRRFEMAKLVARIDGVTYDLRESEGTSAGELAEKWVRFARDGRQTWLVTDLRRRVWVDWSRVTSFEVSEADAY